MTKVVLQRKVADRLQRQMRGQDGNLPLRLGFFTVGYRKGGVPLCLPEGVLVGRSPQIWAKNANFAL
jgi:hypothetical protein